MTYLGDTAQTVSTGVTATAGTTTQILSLYKQVRDWQDILDAAQTEYDRQVARKKIAETRLEIAWLEAEEFRKNLPFYVLGIGAGILALGAMVFFIK